MKHSLFTAFALFIFIQLFSQTPLDKIRSYRTEHEKDIISDFVSFLQIPNVATDTANIGKNAEFLVRLMQAKGITNVSLLQADEKKFPPVVFGEVNTPGATKTVIFYAHYDGQPVNPSLWSKGLHPFQPQLLNGRADEKAVIQTVS